MVCDCRFGRKITFLVSNVINIVSGFLMAVVPDYTSILVFRALLGFSLKGGWMASYVLRTEPLSVGVLGRSGSDGVLDEAFVCCVSHRDGGGEVQTHRGDPVPDVLQHREPDPPPAGLLHH